ncbi:MAG: YHS domain-containing protein [Pirellulaceae bacterium]|jgi:YHS domain-containing protein
MVRNSNSLSGIGLSFVIATFVVGSPTRVQAQAEKNIGASKVALNGYCPVCLATLSKWEAGTSEHRIQYDGQLYYFPGVEQKQTFMKSPEKFVPTLGGDCAVSYLKDKARVPGDLDYGVQHKGRFYFFADKQQKAVFLANPDAFEKVDLALSGNCAVSKMELRRDVPGSAEFTVVHRGFRFQFSNAENKALFEATPTKYEDAGQPLLALDGFCAVCLRDGNGWVKGSEAFSTLYDGREYRFPAADQRNTFLAAPQKYIPVLGGDCVVCLVKMNKRVEGSNFHTTYYRDRLFLFPSGEIKQQFKAAPEAYANADVALQGNCAVCLVKGGKQVPGSAQFQYLYDGLRYVFPSNAELTMFKTDPAGFVRAIAEQQQTPPVTNENTANNSPNSAPLTNPTKLAENPAAQGAVDTTDAGKLISIKGVSGCAGCDHGVAPLKSPQELGLAVVAADGSIYVIEEAHALYKQIYEARFGEINLAVSGTIIQRKGKFVWLEPRSVKALQ